MSRIGHNGGPSLSRMTAKQKLELIRRIVEMTDLTAAQKCVGVGIVLESDQDGMAVVTTNRLRLFADANADTVSRATSKLEQLRVINVTRERGKPNRYRVMPAHVVNAIIDAYNHKKVQPIKGGTVPPIEGGGAPPIQVGGERVEPPTRMTGTSEKVGGIEGGGLKERSPRTPLKENNKSPRPTVESYNSASACGREAAAKIDHKKLEAFLLDACNGALADPAIAPALLNLSTPMWWIEQGADLHRDILPTLRSVAARKHNDPIVSWEYFNKPIADAMKKRARSLDDISGAVPVVDVSPEMERNRRINERLRAKQEALQKRG